MGLKVFGAKALMFLIAADFTLGITFSSIARNQLQTMQMTFFFIPLLLKGIATLPRRSIGMFRACVRGDGRRVVKIYR